MIDRLVNNSLMCVVTQWLSIHYTTRQNYSTIYGGPQGTAMFASSNLIGRIINSYIITYSCVSF